MSGIHLLDRLLAENPGLRIVSYHRVSTQEQSYQMSISDAQRRFEALGSQQFFFDIESRGNNQRPSLLLLKEKAEQREFDCLLISSIDRLTASSALYEELQQIFDRCEISLVSLDGGFDLKTDEGDFMGGLAVMLSRQELKKIRRRSQRGHEGRRAAKRANCVPRRGYKNQDGQYVLDRTPWLCLLETREEYTVYDLCRETIALYIEHRSQHQAIAIFHTRFGLMRFRRKKTQSASKTNVLKQGEEYRPQRRQSSKGIFLWTETGFKRWILSPVLRGHTPYKTRRRLPDDSSGRRKYGGSLPQEQWTIVQDTHPDQRMISEKEWAQIQEIRAINSTLYGAASMNARRPSYSVTGLCKCAVCGGRMKPSAKTKLARRGGEKVAYFQCRAYLRRECTAKRIMRSDIIEAAVIEALVQKGKEIATASEPSSATKGDSPQVQELRLQLKALQAVPGDLPTVQNEISRIEEQIAQVKVEEQAKAKTSAEQESRLLSAMTPGYWGHLSEEEKFHIFHWLVEEILIQQPAEEGERPFVQSITLKF